MDGRGESHSVQLGFKALRVTFRRTCGLLFYVDEAAKNNVQFKKNHAQCSAEFSSEICEFQQEM